MAQALNAEAQTWTTSQNTNGQGEIGPSIAQLLAMPIDSLVLPQTTPHTTEHLEMIETDEEAEKLLEPLR